MSVEKTVIHKGKNGKQQFRQVAIMACIRCKKDVPLDCHGVCVDCNLAAM